MNATERTFLEIKGRAQIKKNCITLSDHYRLLLVGTPELLRAPPSSCLETQIIAILGEASVSGVVSLDCLAETNLVKH